ncbi:ral GTPase-activating protein subunit beta-like isoform X1 [Ylistrum balloti]|uniref:ral GTPase-activating protein subunit beta-like isoform X1 n=1 Tax=Ylistrum balloti TaxID=509963 RepID=UPI002905F776|nr:ral GTPase-activating protein subunit beta-like isoform X1 [Ylistrum balloti]XP_060069950.1 ral GTPase-activating protein subunit beta-like isoform X1 [Ylistrum balloti]
MYAEWASLQDDIQCDKANQSVLHKFPPLVGRDVAFTVVKHIASSINLAANNSEPSNLNTDKDVKWAMEVLCFGLSLPLSEHETIKECVLVYFEWLSACTSPKICVPRPVKENPNPYAQDMIHHLLNLFVPRPGSGVDLVKRQALLCHRVLRCIEDVAEKSNVLTRDTWETLLRFLLAANDSLLSPPTEKDDTGLTSYDIGDHLCERVLSVLFEMWLLACHKCFPSPSLWKTFRNMCVNWRHHEALVTQWHKVNHNLTSRLLKIMYGANYPELQLNETESQFISPDMTDDCVAQCWFRFLHIIQNPVDLCHPEIIGGTPKFLQLRSGEGLDPTQHECLQKLPYIFYKAMRGISILINAFLGISQSLKAEEEMTQPPPSNRHSVTVPPVTPPGQRKSTRPMSVLAGTLSQKGSSKSSSVTTKSAVPPPSNFPGQLLLDSRQPLAPTRPRCNSVLHLYGAWLFDAALARVRLLACHRGPTVNARADRRTNSFTDTRQGSISLDYHSDLSLSVDNTYETGRAEALGALCRIFCAHKTGEEILPVYYSRFYIAMYYGLQTSDNSLSGQVLASILFNSCDLLRVDLDGVQILVPYILDALQLILSDQSTRLKLSDSNVDCHNVELRRSCIQLLLSLLCLPLHFKDLEINDIVSGPETPVQSITFISLKKKIMELLLKALYNAKDPTNTQMLLGGLMLIVQDLAMCEGVEQTTLQPQHDTSGDSDSHGDTSRTSMTSMSSDSSYHESSYHRLPLTSQDLETAYGLFGDATALVCHRLMASWKTDLNTALAAMELLGGLAKVNINPPNLLMCKRTVKWICEFIVYQCSRPAPSHSRDLHSMIVAAFKCLTLWLVEHSRLMYDKECLINVLEVVELGISGSKSQKVTGENHNVSVKDAKTVTTQNRASDPPKFKGEKQLMPASMRVKDAAESVLTSIIQHVGAFPPPCGPESLFSLLDEKSLLKYCKGVGFSEQASPFRYFVLENSIIVGLLEQPLGNVEDPLPNVTALIRGPFGRHAWTMQLRHSPRNKNVNAKSHLSDPGRPLPMENVGIHHNVKHRHFPESVDKIPLTQADKSIPTLESLVTEKERANLTKLKSFIEKQVQFENQISSRSKQDLSKSKFPNPDTECKPPKVTQEFQTARLFLSHYGFLSLESLKEPKNSSIPPALVMLDTTNSGLFTDLESLDTVTARDNDTVHIFYVKSGQKLPQEILNNVTSRNNVQPQFLEFLHSLGWPVDIRKHAGWTGHISTSWKITEPDDLDEGEFQLGTGGCIYDGRQQVLYWADVSSEVAFVVPSIETYNTKMLSVDSSGERSPLFPHHQMEKQGSEPTHKPKSLSLERTLTSEVGDRIRGDRESPSSPQEPPPVRFRNQRRQPAHMIGPDTKMFVVWLENFEDHDNFPTGELLGVTSTGMEHFVTTSTSSTSSTHKLQEKDTFIIFIHALKNGLFRIHMQGQTNRVSMAIPLVDGMVVSRRVLGTMVRQTSINICRRKRLESELYQPPHVRRKHRIQEIVKNYHLKMSEPEFYTALFQDVPK